MNVLISLRRRRAAATLALAAVLACTPPAGAHGTQASAASALSALPVAVLLAAPALLLSGGVALTVVAVEAAADGSVWVLERAADGARASLHLAGGSAVAVGTTLVVTALSTGWLLGTASEVLAFIPNEIGAALLYNERVTR